MVAVFQQSGRLYPPHSHYLSQTKLTVQQIYREKYTCQQINKIFIELHYIMRVDYHASLQKE